MYILIVHFPYRASRFQSRIVCYWHNCESVKTRFLSPSNVLRGIRQTSVSLLVPIQFANSFNDFTALPKSFCLKLRKNTGQL